MAQGWHVALLLAPEEALKVPASHAVQSDCEEEPLTVP
jgi:hypothetical protein